MVILGINAYHGDASAAIVCDGQLIAAAEEERFAPFIMSYRDIFPELARLVEDLRSTAVNKILQRVNCFLVRKAERVVTPG